MKFLYVYLALIASSKARPGRANNDDPEQLGAALKYIPDDVAQHYNF